MPFQYHANIYCFPYLDKSSVALSISYGQFYKSTSICGMPLTGTGTPTMSALLITFLCMSTRLP